jgi:hypothetical protein
LEDKETKPAGNPISIRFQTPLRLISTHIEKLKTQNPLIINSLQVEAKSTASVTRVTSRHIQGSHMGQM